MTFNYGYLMLKYTIKQLNEVVTANKVLISQ